MSYRTERYDRIVPRLIGDALSDAAHICADRDEGADAVE
jgi:hypothetical protein